MLRMSLLEAVIWLQSLPRKVMFKLRVEERSLFASLGFRVGPQLFFCAEGLHTHYSSNGPGVSDDTQQPLPDIHKAHASSLK